MKSDYGQSASEGLAAHAQWISSLARELISDPHTAEDLAQQTLVRALEKGPDEPAALRSWLRKVLRNLFYERLRSRRNQRQREEAVALREDGVSATDDIVERMQAEERLSTALHELPEPYRKTLFLRYFDELPPREIADQLGIPLATVKSRLHRGLAQLRDELDEEYGDRQTWMNGLAAIAATAPLPVPSAALPLGGLAMNMKAAWIVGALTLAGGLFLTLRETEKKPLEEVAALEPESTPSFSSGGGGRSSRSKEDNERRRPVREPKEPVERTTRVTENKPLVVVEGQAFDGEGSPLAAIALQIRGAADEGVLTEASGSFRIETEKTEGRIEVKDSSWVTLRSGAFDERTNVPPIVVAAPALRLGGIVVDEWGQGLSEARITVTLPDDFEQRFPVRLDSSSPEQFEATSEDGGRFTLPETPFVSGALLHASHPGYQPLTLELENVSNENLQLELTRPEIPEERALRGVVLREDGTPATEAHVALGAATVPTNRTGEFVIDLGRTLSGNQLIAIEKGSRPALLELSGPPWDSPLEEVILQLGPEPLRVEGIVLGADDQPVADAKVWIADGTSFGVLGNVPLQREAMMAGAPLPKEGIDFLGTAPNEDGNDNFGNHMPLQAPNAILNYVTTDAEGRFELPGLDDRTYTLHALGPNLGSGVIVPEVRAGQTGLTLRMNPALAYSSFSGTVQLANGEPVSGVLIYPYLPSVEAQLRVFGGSSGVSRWFSGSSRTTDENGRFEFGPVLNLGVNFYIESDDILPTYGSIEDVTDPENHVFEVVARLHAQAELLDPTAADELAVFDSEGTLQILRTMRASGHTTWERIPFERGRTAPFALTSEAVELRLYKAGEVIATHPLNLRPGELNQLRY